jgi:hypothetical protein
MMLPSGNDAAYLLAEYFGHVLKMKKYYGVNERALNIDNG